MWFKNGLKAQKLLAQGNALGILAVNKAPCKGKSLINCLVPESFCPYRATGLRPSKYPGRCPGLRASALSGRAGLTCESSGRISYHKNKKGNSEWN